MARFFARLHHTVSGRMLLYVVIPTVLIFVVILVLGTRAAFRAMREEEEENLQVHVELAASVIEHKNNRAVLTAQRMAEAQVAGMFGDRQASLAFAENILKGSKEFTGCYFGYEPNADGNDAASLGQLPAESMDSKGRFIPYWFVTPGRGQHIELEPLVDVDKSLYYQGLKAQYQQNLELTYMVTEPYIYQGKMIVEQTYPIVIDGAFVGIAGVDFALADVEADLRRLAEREGVDLFLISSRDRFIAATTDPVGDSSEDNDSRLKTQEVSDTDYADLFGKLLERRRSGKPVRAVDPLDGHSCYFATTSIPTGGWTLIVRENEEIVLMPVWHQVYVRVALATVGLSAIIALLLTMTFRVGRQISRAVAIAERVAQGDLTEEIVVGNVTDETGALLLSLQKMNQNLNALVGQAKRSSVQLNSTATELAATSRQQDSTASSFGASSNEIAAAARQISATTGELVQTMEEVHEAAMETTNLATASRSGLENMEANMRGLDQATSSIGDKLAVINEKASNITGVITTITKVADQTNLLSVNAAIEAEKAGEYGVGFLVVAREIRRLADQTAASTLDIEQMVQQMHASVSAGVMEMDRFTDQVRHSVKDVVEISRQMEKIIERVTANSARFERVHESMQSQLQGAQQISDAMADLTGNARQTAEAVGEYSRAAADLREAIEALQVSITSFNLKS